MINRNMSYNIYMDKKRFIVYVKTEDIYVDTAKDVETRLPYFKL